MKVRHPETKGVIAIQEAQLEVFKNQGWKQVSDEVPTDLELRDQAALLARITGEKLNADDDIAKLRAAHEKAHPPSKAAGDSDESAGQGDEESGDSSRITGSGDENAEGDKTPGRKGRSSANREKSE